MILNEKGLLVEKAWQALPEHHPQIELDACIIMPNHIHGILLIKETESEQSILTVGAQPAVPFHDNSQKRKFGAVTAGSLPAVVRSFKASVARQINQRWGSAGAKLWQRNYWEHVIRTEKSLHSIREYIENNPAQWDLDKLNPDYVDPEY